MKAKLSHLLSSPGVLFCLPQVRKTGCRFRSIVSSVNTYNYILASYSVAILQPISTNQYTVRLFKLVSQIEPKRVKAWQSNNVLFRCILSTYKSASWGNTRHLSWKIVFSYWSSGFTHPVLFYGKLQYWNLPLRRATFFLTVNTTTKSMVLPWVRHWDLS